MIQEHYIDGNKVDYNDVYKSSITGMLRSLDPHSNYFDRQEFEDMLADQHSEYQGIGASILNYPNADSVDTYVTATFQNSPAARAGLRFADRIDAVGTFAELEQHMDTPTKRFSTGMLCRLSFAVAVQFPADIYVFDEVLAVVDGEFQGRCLKEVSQLRDAGKTVIFVSHDLDQVAEVCDRVMWLERGRLQRLGQASDVLDEYGRVHAA